jgi:hypothetical protein
MPAHATGRAAPVTGWIADVAVAAFATVPRNRPRATVTPPMLFDGLPVPCCCCA